MSVLTINKSFNFALLVQLDSQFVFTFIMLLSREMFVFKRNEWFHKHQKKYEVYKNNYAFLIGHNTSLI